MTAATVSGETLASTAVSTAGVAAGATVFAYCTESDYAARLLQAGAHCTFQNMQQLPQLLINES